MAFVLMAGAARKSQCGRSGGVRYRCPVHARVIASDEASLRRYQPDQVPRDCLNRSTLRYPHFGGD
ncbi:hypothetical protein XOCgx_1032 [Xanthomonas oryzae pv. oryzicola]|nr:hypothetical protein XOCgx_1032 [Xanthomonas oryzae pv. oryzicola]